MTIIDLAEMPFYSICGEGTEIGKPAVFIRTFGCNKVPKCSYCDTSYSYEGKPITLTLSKLIKELDIISAKTQCRTLFLTGGEPTLQEEALIILLRYMHGAYTILQTNGTRFSPVLFGLVDELSVDVKGPSSGLQSNLSTESKIDRMFSHKKRQFKFVVSNTEDLAFAKWAMRQLTGTIILQPEANTLGIHALAQWVLADPDIARHDIRVLPQLHRILGVK